MASLREAILAAARAAKAEENEKEAQQRRAPAHVGLDVRVMDDSMEESASGSSVSWATGVLDSKDSGLSATARAALEASGDYTPGAGSHDFAAAAARGDAVADPEAARQNAVLRGFLETRSRRRWRPRSGTRRRPWRRTTPLRCALVPRFLVKVDFSTGLTIEFPRSH